MIPEDFWRWGASPTASPRESFSKGGVPAAAPVGKMADGARRPAAAGLLPPLAGKFTPTLSPSASSTEVYGWPHKQRPEEGPGTEDEEVEARHEGCRPWLDSRSSKSDSEDEGGAPAGKVALRGGAEEEEQMEAGLGPRGASGAVDQLPGECTPACSVNSMTGMLYPHPASSEGEGEGGQLWSLMASEVPSRLQRGARAAAALPPSPLNAADFAATAQDLVRGQVRLQHCCPVCGRDLVRDQVRLQHCCPVWGRDLVHP